MKRSCAHKDSSVFLMESISRHCKCTCTYMALSSSSAHDISCLFWAPIPARRLLFRSLGVHGPSLHGSSRKNFCRSIKLTSPFPPSSTVAQTLSLEKGSMDLRRCRRNMSCRVLDSAKGLANSAFSGVPGTEAELRDPRSTSKLTGTELHLSPVRGKDVSPIRPKNCAQVSRKRDSHAFRSRPAGKQSHREQAEVDRFFNAPPELDPGFMENQIDYSPMELDNVSEGTTKVGKERSGIRRSSFATSRDHCSIDDFLREKSCILSRGISNTLQQDSSIEIHEQIQSREAVSVGAADRLSRQGSAALERLRQVKEHLQSQNSPMQTHRREESIDSPNRQEPQRVWWHGPRNAERMQIYA